MNAFELFCMVFFVLDHAWDQSHNEELGRYLSDADPFIWEDEGSADPAIYSEYIRDIPKEVSVGDSYGIAERYVESLSNADILHAFRSVSPEQWLRATKRYLARGHKGGEARQVGQF